MARPRKPTQLRILAGTLPASQAPKAEPKPPFAAPHPPPYLSDDERLAWNRCAEAVSSIRICAAQDFAGFESLVCTFVEAQRLRASLREAGSSTYTTVSASGSAMLRPRPELSALAAVEARLLSWLTRFGLTPADRSRVSDLGGVATLGGPEDEFA
jgi:hypothetical protein